MSFGAFYRFNFEVTGRDAKIPMSVYAGPQMGLTRLKTTQGTSSTDFSAGGQLGANFPFSEHFALNFHVFQWDTVFADNTQLIITQSIGVKYYF